MTTEGKNEFVKAGACAPLSKLLEDKSEQVLLNALRAITALAEAPAARIAFAPSVGKVALGRHIMTQLTLYLRLQNLKSFRAPALMPKLCQEVQSFVCSRSHGSRKSNRNMSRTG